MPGPEGSGGAATDDLVGRTVGNYVLKREVGRGGMGTVYLAEHVRLGKRVAVKVLLPERGRDPGIVNRFFNEARAASDIRNAHIVDVIDFGDLEGGRPYLMMEWLDGRSLRDAIAAEAPFPLRRAVRITGGICRALIAAHAHGVIHRDLKPDNIFLVHTDEDHDFVKVVDFGIAKLLVRSETTGPQTAVNAVLGTPEYMSPEQCRGENATLDGRSDVYSLGLILYEMVTGRRPFDATSYVGNIVAHLTKEPPPPSTLMPGLTPAVERVILKALSKDRDQRQANMTELWSELSRAADTTAPQQRTSTPPAGTRVSRPHRATIPLGGALPTVENAAPATVMGQAPSSMLLPRLVLGAGVLALVAVGLLAVLHGRGASPGAVAGTAPGSPATTAAAPSKVTPPPAATPAATPGGPAGPSPGSPTAPPTGGAPAAPGPSTAPPAPSAGSPATGSPLASPARAVPPAAPARTRPPGETTAHPAPVGRGGGSDSDLERRLAQESARLAPSGRRYGAPFSAELAQGKGHDQYLELEGGHCYTLVAVASDAVRELHTFLWDPSGKRLGQDASTSNVSCFTACAIESGRYRVHTRLVGGGGRYRASMLRSQ